ncbi:MAG: Asp-tRNA(Asn)/Glu-tRNA(Gln) amidotransferase subunit GatB [Treponema sp.]|nr:Asp-tRNA(Asn)/Glu-tRNA(Gln) amidotransferase subunit GatB [Treponema sp.]MCL2251375.1 Asp-tRNA(Asn)/Glu-tRNA(Gln) amidotransferase subunit GatB [Treponema sp.]
MKWETVIGLEVHAELSTKSKIFCACTTAYGGEPNTHVCPVCSGMPGVLPVLNREVVEYALRLGFALNCQITRYCKFDRKNYFYPDLPKAYQVSQLYAPICRDGFLEIEADGQKKKIRIREIHMEEDAGKLNHGTQGSFMDFNRCGVPLLEIVTLPDFTNASEVNAYLEKLRETLLYLDICDCKMQEGSLRADINLSVRHPGEELGVRTETKNMNSFKAIGRAIEYEIERQIDILEDGGKIIQETRRWDDDKGTSSGMRSKENAQDYRYFPDPDLLPINIDDDWLLCVKKNLPELAFQKRERYTKDFGISSDEAGVLTCHKNISNLFEKLAQKSGQATESAHLISGEIMRLMNNVNMLPEDLSIDAEKLAVLIGFVVNGKINRASFKETAEAVFTNNADPEKYITEKNLLMVSDDKAVIEAVEKVISENQDSVAEYRAGKEKVFGFLMGMVMKKLGKGGNPELAKNILQDKLNGEKK